MEYTPWITPGITPYFAEHFSDLTYEDALAFTSELVRRIPERREQLEMLVRSTLGYESWVADFTTASLETLGAWAKDNVPTRKPMAADEPLWRISPACPVPREKLRLPVPEFLIADLGESVMADIGIYMSEILRMSDPCWKWVTCRDAGRKYVIEEHHNPIVSWRGQTKRGGFAPFFDARNCVWGVLKGDSPSRDLRDFVEYRISQASMLREKYGAAPLPSPSVKKPRRPKAF